MNICLRDANVNAHRSVRHMVTLVKLILKVLDKMIACRDNSRLPSKLLGTIAQVA